MVAASIAPMNERSLANLKPPWQPGQSGNPAGRKPGPLFSNALNVVLSSRMKELFPQLAKQEPESADWDALPPIVILKALLREAMNGDTKAIEMLWERLEGKTPVSFSNVDGTNLDLDARQQTINLFMNDPVAAEHMIALANIQAEKEAMIPTTNGGASGQEQSKTIEAPPQEAIEVPPAATPATAPDAPVAKKARKGKGGWTKGKKRAQKATETQGNGPSSVTGRDENGVSLDLPPEDLDIPGPPSEEAKAPEPEATPTESPKVELSPLMKAMLNRD